MYENVRACVCECVCVCKREKETVCSVCLCVCECNPSNRFAKKGVNSKKIFLRVFLFHLFQTTL